LSLILTCNICQLVCEAEDYDPAPSELLVLAFSEAHKHTAQEWAEYRRQEHEMVSNNYEAGGENE